jgi:competence protein ComEC
MWWVVGCYVLIAVVGLAPRELLAGRRRVALLVAWVAVGFATPLVRDWIPSEHGASVRCTTLAMGHGLGVVLEFPDGKTLLYDCGRLGSPSGATDSVASYLWRQGKTHVDAVVISHADADHFNGLPELLERFSVGAVYVNPVMFDRQGAALRVLQNSLAQHRLSPRELQAADRFVMGNDIRLEVLLPPPGGMLASSNANSVVMLVEAHGRRLLLTGDLEKQGLELLLRERPAPCDLLLAPHHGSRGSEPARIIQWCGPRWTIVSGALNRRTDEALAAYRLAGTLTALDGAIQYEIAADHATLRHWNASTGWRTLEVQGPPLRSAP